MIRSVAAPATNASAWLHGWVGDANASVNVHQSGDSVSVNGRVGDYSVGVWRTGPSEGSARLNGSLMSRRGSWPVSVWVNGAEGSRNYSGWIGREPVNLRESRWGRGVHVTGWVGSRNVDVDVDSGNGWLRMDGRVGFGIEGRVSLSGGQSPAAPPINHEGLIPLLAIAGLPQD